MIGWTCTKEECQIVARIAGRAYQIAQEVGVEYPKIGIIMDVEACHCNGNPLRLDDLHNAEKEDFAHDVFGIRANIDRTTGKLLNCFSPRYSMQEDEEWIQRELKW